MADNIRPAGVFDTSYSDDLALNRTIGDRLRVYGGFLLLLLIPVFSANGILGSALPIAIPSVWVSIISSICIFVIAAQGLNILVGYTGQISLGHAAFMAVGAYSGALLGKGFEVTIMGELTQIGPFPFWVALPLAALFTGLVGLLFGLPSLRVKGFYLAMATLAAQFIIPWVIENPLKPWTNAPLALQEIPPPTLFGISFASREMIYYIIVPLAVYLMLFARNILRTRTGRAFVSVRDNDLAAELLGINVFWYKLQAFFLSAVYAGIAGALLAFERNALDPDFFSLVISIELLAMLVIGGAGFPLAPLFGVAFVKLLNSWLIPTIGPFFSATLPTVLPFVDVVNIGAALRPMLFGTALVLFLILEPRGLAYRWEILRIAWKIRPYSY
ncbi:MAG: branched-chain amino acid ABC transporter permease [Chloroflexota bacterium]